MAADNLARVPEDDAADAPLGATGADRGASNGAAASAAAPIGVAGLGAVRDIAVTMSMEIGRARVTIADLMRLGEGSVVELERMADEPLDVFVNGTLVARGEAVVVGERFGIRLTEVVASGGLVGS